MWHVLRALRVLCCPPLLLLLLRYPCAGAAAPAAVASTDQGLAGGSFLADALSGVSACCDPHRYTYDIVCVNNNLGGRGPDRYKAPARPNEETLRYRGVPAADGRAAAPRSVDLVVSATSSYATRSPYKNGLHGSLVQINVDAGNTVDLELQLRDSTSDRAVTAREMTLLVLDLDEDIGRMSRTAISARGYDDSFVSDTSELREVELKNNATWFLSQKAGSENDEPTDCCGHLFESQLDKAVAFHFTDTSRVELKVHVSYGRSSHNFLLSLQLCTSCANPTPDRPPTPAPRPHSHRSKVHLESSNRVETILWSIQDLLHLPHGKDDKGPQPQPGPPTAGQGQAAGANQQPQQEPRPQPLPTPAPPPPTSNQGRLPLEGGLPEGTPPDPQPQPQPVEEPQPEPEPAPVEPPAPQPPEPVETGGFPPTKPDGNPWPMAVNRACHGSEVMWAWCKGECIGSCGSCGCAGSPCHADFESDKQVPLDCALAAWSVWTTCSTTCGIGWHNRMRHVVQPPEYGGQPCRGSLWQMDSCQSAPCSDRSFVLGHWSQWQGCDSRSPGYRFRKRDVREVNSGSGVPSDSLPSGTTKQVDICPNVQERNCVLSQWSEWESCNQPCGGGQTYRRRSLEMLPTNGGHCAPETLQEARPCHTMPCPDFDNCQLGNWGPWSACSRECPGSHTRSRDIIRNEQFCAAPLKEIAPCHQPGCIVTDCKWDDWGQWGACTCDCGGGTKRRNRQLAAAPRNGGKLCDPEDKSEITACNTQPCQECRDGEWGPWTRWTPCSAKCGSGVRYRHRDIAKQANECGKPAVGSSQQFVVCHSSGGMGEDCGDRDCIVGQWSSWSACSCSCFGIRERTRTIAQFQKGNGKPCTDVELKTVEPCNPGPGQQADGGCGQEKPPVDCTVSPWSVWGQCSVTCGGGNRERSRAILTPAANNGKLCGTTSLEEMEQCSLAHCTQGGCLDCIWGQWSEWGSCTKCGGEKYRQRIIRQLPNYCGKPCDSRPAREVTSCSSECEKKQYCTWNGWATWGDCSHSCGVAVKSRQRFLGLTPLRPPEYLLVVNSGDDKRICHGTETVTEQCLPFVSCEQDCTPTDCQFSGWTDWVDRMGCVGLCERRRQVRVVNNECGRPCSGPLEETTACAPTHCHVTDCRLSPWSDWTCVGMNGDCSGQSKRRTRSVQQEPQNGGKACVGALEETKVCGSPDRPPASPCTLDAWSEWSVCTASCGNGWHTRFRSIRTLAMNGGRLCRDSLEEGEMCTLQPCPDDADGCTLSSWSEWRGCMDYGQQFRSRELNPATGRRYPCNAAPGQLLPVRETRPCDESQSFVVDCTVSPWTEWYTCDKTCGGGEQQRDRQVEAYPLNGGHKCPRDLRMIRGCNMQPCQAPKPSGSCKDGSWEPWAPWSQCSTTCGGGISWRTRLRAEMATECGKPATGLSRETKYCVNDRPCTPDVDCRLSEWSLWTGCSKTCDGIKSRSRKIKIHGAGHGTWCRGPTRETRACRPCNGRPAIDCLLGEWGSWSECPVTCGVSQMRRERLVTQEAHHGGRACDGSLVDIRDCGLRACPSPPPVDCLWGQWGPWGACSEPGGQRNRFRRILRMAKFGGQPCEVGAVEQTVGCKRPHYESFCMWAQWEAWSPCTDWTPCNTWGKRSRVRHLVLSEGGAAVPSTAINSNIDSYSTYYDADAKAGAKQHEGRPQWLSAQGVRLEILMAFVCGYFGRVVVAAGGRAMTRRRGQAGEASLRMGGVVASARAWFGSPGATLHQYMPVAQAPFEAA